MKLIRIYYPVGRSVHNNKPVDNFDIATSIKDKIQLALENNEDCTVYLPNKTDWAVHVDTFPAGSSTVIKLEERIERSISERMGDYS